MSPLRLSFGLAALLLLAPVAGAQPQDSAVARPVYSTVYDETPAAGTGCGGARRGGEGPCLLPEPTLGSVPMEATLGGTGGGGEGMASVTLEAGLPVLRLGGASIAFVAAETALGAGSGLRAGAGLAGGVVLAESQALRLGVRAGGWAERSPVGTAYGPLVAANARLYFVRVSAGAVVAGAPVQYGRVVLEVPLAVSSTAALPFVGLGVEARHYADTDATVWTVAATFGL